ncbi:hypothetical protein B0H15DRAFT_799761 [Mycena belliarum]|uniref:Uncharacterized protein n=1 Tax=Mycena belliarum TaxID=1033014 RepID=A0AAD6XTL4_9AGAR|nr:hypothetical protein B0H15DRAFT_799761 [Mycena belliae]
MVPSQCWGYYNNASAWSLGCQISGVALDVAKNVLCINDPSIGVRLYRLAEKQEVKSLRVPVKRFRRVRQVCLADGNTAIVSGSDHGLVYVHDRRSGDVTTKLKVHPNEWIQTVAAADISGVSTIFAAQSRDISGPNDIFVWRKNAINLRFFAQIAANVQFLFKLVVVLIAAAAVWEKLIGRYVFIPFM